MRAPSCLASLVAAGLVTVRAACSDGPTGSNDLPFQAQIDGQAFVATNTDFSVSNGGGRLLISGIRAVGTGQRQVSVQLDNWNGPGTYALGAPASGALGFVTDRDASDNLLGNWETTAAAPGQVVVTSFDATGHTIKGTFSFEVRSNTGQTLSVTQGRFMGSYFVDP